MSRIKRALVLSRFVAFISLSQWPSGFAVLTGSIKGAQASAMFPRSTSLVPVLLCSHSQSSAAALYYCSPKSTQRHSFIRHVQDSCSHHCFRTRLRLWPSIPRQHHTYRPRDVHPLPSLGQHRLVCLRSGYLRRLTRLWLRRAPDAY